MILGVNSLVLSSLTLTAVLLLLAIGNYPDLPKPLVVVLTNNIGYPCVARRDL